MFFFFDDTRTSMGSLQTCSGSFSRRGKLDRLRGIRFRRKGLRGGRGPSELRMKAEFSKFRALESPVGSVFQDGTFNLVLNIQCHELFLSKRTPMASIPTKSLAMVQLGHIPSPRFENASRDQNLLISIWQQISDLCVSTCWPSVVSSFSCQLATGVSSILCWNP